MTLINRIQVIDPEPSIPRYGLMLLGLASDGQRVELSSTRHPSEIAESLSGMIDSSLFAGLLGYSKRDFIGTVAGNKFQIYCSSKGRNSWRPVLAGTIESVPAGSQIKASFDFHPLVRVGTVCWLYGVSSFAVSMMSTADWFGALQFAGMAVAVGPIVYAAQFIAR